MRITCIKCVTFAKMTDQSKSKEEINEPFTFDAVLAEIGEFGRYQILSGILTCLSITLSTCALFNFVFSIYVPEHRFGLNSILLINQN